MPIGSYPKDAVLDNRGILSRPWDVWMNKLQNIADFGNPPSSDTEITAADGIRLVTNHMRIKGSAGAPVTITANPQISPGTYDSQLILVEGLDNTATVTMNNGNGVELKTGSVVFDKNTILEFTWNKAQMLWIKTQ